MRLLFFLLGMLLAPPVFAAGGGSDIATGRGSTRSNACSDARAAVPFIAAASKHIGGCSCYQEKEGVVTWWHCEVPYSWEKEPQEKAVDFIEELEALREEMRKEFGQ